MKRHEFYRMLGLGPARIVVLKDQNEDGSRIVVGCTYPQEKILRRQDDPYKHLRFPLRWREDHWEMDDLPGRAVMMKSTVGI